MQRRTVGREDEELMRGAWQWAGEAAATHGCGVRVVLHPTTRVGVWEVRAEAAAVVDGRAVRILARYRCEWPSATHQTLAGALMAAQLKLDAILTQPPPLLAPAVVD